MRVSEALPFSLPTPVESVEPAGVVNHTAVEVAASEKPAHHIPHAVLTLHQDRFDSGNPLGMVPTEEMRRERPGLEFTRVHQSPGQSPVHARPHNEAPQNEDPTARAATRSNALRHGLNYLDHARNAARTLSGSAHSTGPTLAFNARPSRRPVSAAAEPRTFDDSVTEARFSWPSQSAFSQHIESLSTGARHDSGNGRTVA